MAFLTVAALFAFAAWAYLTLGHGRFWAADQRLPVAPEVPGAVWPQAVAVVPARDEADVVAESIGSLLDQTAPQLTHVFLVDDGSSDGTGDVARAAADALGAADRLTVLRAPKRPAGWVGKMWAVATGVKAARKRFPDVPWLLLTDADIAHGPGELRALLAAAEGKDDEVRRDLVSLMVKLHCKGFWEGLLIPPFVYFFQMLYPFPRVNDPTRKEAGAAGGVMLVRARALADVGGIGSIKGAVIDDCTLAAKLKPHGAIRLALTDRARSIRPYDGPGEIWKMVARSAYTQLKHSPLALVGTLFGMALVYLAPPIATVVGAVAGDVPTTAFGALAWCLMALTTGPTYALYGRTPVLGLVLPVAAVLYAAMTVGSALDHMRGRGAAWKGRVGAGAAGDTPNA